VVNDLFLKTPSRIDALGMMLIITLMVWRLMERTMRAHVENAKTTLPGWDHRETTMRPDNSIQIANKGVRNVHRNAACRSFLAFFRVAQM